MFCAIFWGVRSFYRLFVPQCNSRISGEKSTIQPLTWWIIPSVVAPGIDLTVVTYFVLFFILYFRKGSMFWGYLYQKILTKMWCWKIEVTQVRLPISISINSLIIGGNLTKFGKLVEKGLKFNTNGKFWGYLKKPVRKLRLLYINVKILKK